jgi:hypothetical protein
MDRLDIERFRDRWVAVGDDGLVVADAATLENLHQTLASTPSVHVVIQRVPAVDDPLLVGLR